MHFFQYYVTSANDDDGHKQCIEINYNYISPQVIIIYKTHSHMNACNIMLYFHHIILLERPVYLRNTSYRHQVLITDVLPVKLLYYMGRKNLHTWTLCEFNITNITDTLTFLPDMIERLVQSVTWRAKLVSVQITS